MTNYKVGTKFQVIGNHNESPYSVFRLNKGGYDNSIQVPIGEVIELERDDCSWDPKVRFKWNGHSGIVESSINNMLERKTLKIFEINV